MVSNHRKQQIAKVNRDAIKTGAILIFCLMIGGSFLLIGTAAADSTTQTVEGVNSSDLTAGDPVEIIVVVDDLNSSSTLVQSVDATNNTATLDTEIGNNTVPTTISWTDSTSTATVDLSNETDYPSSLSADEVNVTLDQSVTEFYVGDSGDLLSGSDSDSGSLLGSIGSGDNGTVMLLALLAVGYLVTRD